MRECVTRFSTSFLWFEPIWATAEQDKVFANSVLILDVFTPKRIFLLIVPLKATRDHRYFLFWLRGMQFDSEVWCTLHAELDSEVSCTPWSLTLRYDAHREAWLCNMMHTTELTPRSFLRNFELLTPQCNAHLEAWLRSMMLTAESDSAVWYTAEYGSAGGCTPWILTPRYDAQDRVS